MDNSSMQPQQTDMFGNKLNPNFVVADNQTNQQNTTTANRKPGNWFTHLLPAIGGTVGSIIATPLDLFSGIGGNIIGGAAGSSLGKILENKLEKQSLTSGVGGQALLGAAGGLGGSLIGAGAEAAKGLITGGADALGTAAGDVAGNALSDASSQTAGDVAQSAAQSSKPLNMGQKVISRIMGLSPQDLPGNPINNVSEGNRLFRVADSLGLSRNAENMIQQLSPKFAEVNNQLASTLANDNSVVPLSEIATRGLDALSQNTLTDSAVGEGKLAVDKVFNTTMQKLATQSSEDGITLNDLHAIRQDLGASVFGKGGDATNPILVSGRTLYKSLGDVIGDYNPQARQLISNQHDMLTLGEQLGQSASSSGGMVRAGVGGLRVPVPVGNTIQNLKYGVGTLLGGAGTTAQIAPLAGQELSQQLGNAISNSQNQDSAQKAQSIIQQGNLSQPSDNIKNIIKNTMPSNSMGLPSVKDIQNAQAKDLAITGGKNYSTLNRLLGIAKTQESNQLSTADIKTVNSYSSGITSLDNIAKQFTSDASAQDIQTAIGNAQKQLTSLAGVTGKDLTSQLPSPYDKPDEAVTKLQNIKQLIDTAVEQKLQTSVNSNKQNANAFLGSLVGAGG